MEYLFFRRLDWRGSRRDPFRARSMDAIRGYLAKKPWNEPRLEMSINSITPCTYDENVKHFTSFDPRVNSRRGSVCTLSLLPIHAIRPRTSMAPSSSWNFRASEAPLLNAFSPALTRECVPGQRGALNEPPSPGRHFLLLLCRRVVVADQVQDPVSE